jgi:ABC-2 type transport system ATP-binding protein
MKALQLEQLCKIYGKQLVALDAIDLNVSAGDFFALLGPNGAGKSTAIGIICSLINKTSGRVTVFGHDLDSDLLGVKRQIGLVPQEFNFNQFEPVIEILLNQAGYYGIARPEARIRAERRLKQLDLWDKRNTIARNLSGGMKRRLMIARALIHEPRLLILDEPTAGVDIEVRLLMWQFLRQINKEGTTIILTTHYLEEAENLCKQIAIIDHGRIIEKTSMELLLARLQCETFVLDLANELTTPPDIPGYTVSLLTPRMLEVMVNKGTGLNSLFAKLSALQLEVVSLRSKQNRLEQLFLDLTQKKSALPSLESHYV